MSLPESGRSHTCTSVGLDDAQASAVSVPILTAVYFLALQLSNPLLCRILTHWHHDHVGGLRPVLELLQALDQSPPRIYKFHDPDADAKVIDHVGDLPSGLLHHARSEEQEEQRGKSNLYLHHLSDGDQLRPDDHGKPVTLQVVHSPGHTVDHICLLLREEGILLTGDHVLGQGTSVFEDLGAYLMSLRKCKRVLEAELDSSKGMQAGCLFPGHGPVVKDGKVALQDYLDHRLDREEQILALLRKPPTDGGSGGVSTEHSSGLHEWTIPNLVSTLYSDYPESLYPAAARGIFLHLRKLALPDDEALQREAVPAIRLDGTRHNGRRVRCVGQGAQSDGQAPKVPEDDPAWLQAMELRWSILHH